MNFETDLTEQLVWKAKDLPIERLFRTFMASCKVEQNAKEQFTEYLQTVEKILAFAKAGFTTQEWEEYLNGDKPCIIAIDGRAASGKTTLANILQIVLDADIIHMDDFFVPLELRSAERFSIPGENIHHERFSEEVLPFVSKREPFSYRIFDCSKMCYNGKREIGNKRFRIVEGSYSCHPIFGRYASITVFSDVSADEQIERIRNRNGEEMLRKFLEQWVPMEEEYFTYYMIRDNADIMV